MLEAPIREGQNGGHEQPVRRAGLVVRVSTDRQAMTEEGSLKNQLQRLRQHIEYKTTACGEEWRQAEVYELRAVSGKDSLRSPEFQRLFADIRSGRVNTILCTALDRISRSVKDFLHFFEVLNEHGVEFVCLKQNYDTTTPQGKLFVTIMMALAEFEREQTSERNREATAARAERGLWNGGRLLGYDLDPNRKGHLIPNPEEVALVNLAFDTYLACGSIAETATALNRRGYRTKAYTSRREKIHPGSEFGTTSVQYLLKNPAYVGKKEVNKKAKGREAEPEGKGYRLVDAVWSGIVEEEKFEKAQRLMAANSRSNHNGSRPVRHSYVLSGGLLHCGRCSAPMEGRSGTGRLGVRYYYYVCRGPDCGLRVAADEIEGAVLNRIQELATNGGLLERLTEETNRRMASQKPGLSAKRRALQRSLDAVKAEADKVLGEWSALEEQAGRVFVTDKLADLARRRTDLERGIAEVDAALKQVEREQVTADAVRSALSEFDEVYACLTPFERKELVRLVLRRAEVGDRQVVLELYGTLTPKTAMAQSRSRSEPPNWLPGQDSNLQPSG
jgi:site-specific DNA recombinase